MSVYRTRAWARLRAAAFERDRPAYAGSVGRRPIPSTTCGQCLEAPELALDLGNLAVSLCRRMSRTGARAARRDPRLRGPASVGAPTKPLLDGAPSRVYPRVCGGSSTFAEPATSKPGLSPRVRGILLEAATSAARNLSPRCPLARRPAARSIPACAGDPTGPTRSRRGATVYPRVCGRDPNSVYGADGLSPRVRGIPCRVTLFDRRHAG